MKSARIRVVIVDDSALIRKLLNEILSDSDDIEVVGLAPDAPTAREVIRATNPDVITLDIEMPGMTGLDFLERLMKLKPTPVVMISTLTVAGADATFRAMEIGAVDFYPKPVIDVRGQLTEYADTIRDKVRAAAQAVLKRQLSLTVPQRPRVTQRFRQELLLIGASTGGTEAIRAVLEGLPANTPPVMIVQHMPEGFTRSFAQRLDKLSPMRVAEASSGMPLLAGHAYLAPGGQHLQLGQLAGQWVCRVSDSEPCNRHRPSVDVLFNSVADQKLASRTSAALLTGMGKDGAAGLLALKLAGAHTIAQDEASCVVFGMPREAINLQAAEQVLSLPAIAAGLLPDS